MKQEPPTSDNFFADHSLERDARSLRTSRECAFFQRMRVQKSSMPYACYPRKLRLAEAFPFGQLCSS
jgi:hypothetical protein